MTREGKADRLKELMLTCAPYFTDLLFFVAMVMRDVLWIGIRGGIIAFRIMFEKEIQDRKVKKLSLGQE